MRASGPVGRPGGQVDFAQESVQRGNSSDCRGSLAVVGIGPGKAGQMSGRALEILEQAEVVVGYKAYIELIFGLLLEKEVVSSGMTREVERCSIAIDRALEGKKVALISSGDPGVYGMAGLVLEILEQKGAVESLEMEIVPGITAATASAACLGAPLMHDFVVISLSDLLTPWEIIKKRLEHACQGDFVVVIYNPASRKRTEQIRQAREIMLSYKKPATPVGIVRNAARKEEVSVVTDLEHMMDYPIDMFTTIIIGNNQTRRVGRFMVTPRGYQL